MNQMTLPYQAQGSELKPWRSEANTPGLGHAPPPPPPTHTNTQHCIFMSRNENIFCFFETGTPKCILSFVTPQ